MPKIDQHIPGTPCWFDLTTPDLDAVTPFYTGLFGWEAVDMPTTGGLGVYRMFRVDGLDVAAASQQLPEFAGQGVLAAWSVYFAGDAAEVARRAADAGGRVTLPPSDVGPSGRVAVMADPGGAVFGVWQAGEHKGAGLTGEPGSMAWCELNTRDYDTCRAYYPEVFGWQGEDLPMDQSRYTIWKLGGAQVAGMLEMTEQWQGIPAHWNLYFAADGTDQAARHAESLGGKVNVPPFDTPYGRLAVLNDPAGTAFSVVTLPPAG
ncbi:MAG TPA: VOC family protein [Actinomycetes bacterium]|nr:VOC family protein [Actinomycetes bacterium]